jgi:hypothetical protein
MEGKKDVDYKSPEYVNNLLKRINAEVGAIIAENEEKMREIYGTAKPTVEMILEKLYEGSPGQVEKALAIRLLVVDAYDWHTLSLPLITYNIGVLRASLAGAPEAEQMPPDLETLLEGFKNLSEAEKSSVYSELGRDLVETKRWDPVRAVIRQKALPEAKRRWLEWKQKGGKKIHHNKMRDILFDEIPELKEAKVPRKTLLDALRSLAREIDPTLVYGVGGKSKKIGP